MIFDDLNQKVPINKELNRLSFNLYFGFSIISSTLSDFVLDMNP